MGLKSAIFAAAASALLAAPMLSATEIYTFTAPALTGIPATEFTLTEPGFITASETIYPGNSALDIITPTHGTKITEIEIFNPTTIDAEIEVLYSDYDYDYSNWAEAFNQNGDFTNTAGFKLDIQQAAPPVPEPAMGLPLAVIMGAGLLFWAVKGRKGLPGMAAV